VSGSCSVPTAHISRVLDRLRTIAAQPHSSLRSNPHSNPTPRMNASTSNQSIPFTRILTLQNKCSVRFARKTDSTDVEWVPNQPQPMGLTNRAMVQFLVIWRRLRHRSNPTLQCSMHHHRCNGRLVHFALAMLLNDASDSDFTALSSIASLLLFSLLVIHFSRYLMAMRHESFNTVWLIEHGRRLRLHRFLQPLPSIP
jgi:hypothetical protein